MASSPSHRFGQIIGDLLEELLTPILSDFCKKRGLYLDKKGKRGTLRSGSKLSWLDKYGNSHDLDFVIERGGSDFEKGIPVAFIEAAWRRYTKHSKNKVQEIQGAILPIAENHPWDKPFIGAVLAGVFTQNSINQMNSVGFKTALFPYEAIVSAFSSVGIDAEFDENTADAVFAKTISQIDALTSTLRNDLKAELIRLNKERIAAFLLDLEESLDRQIDRVSLTPLHGNLQTFSNIDLAIEFIKQYVENQTVAATFVGYEVLVKYLNGDKIEATFKEQKKAIQFLEHIKQGLA
jgi:hypothetical protein